MQESGNTARLEDNSNPTKIYFFIFAIMALIATNVYLYLKYQSTTEVSYQITAEKLHLQDEVDRIEAEVNRLTTENVQLSASLRGSQDSVRTLIANLRERLNEQNITMQELQVAQKELSLLRVNVYEYRQGLEEIAERNEKLLIEQENLQRANEEKQNELRLLAERNQLLNEQLKSAAILKTSRIDVAAIRERSRNREDLTNRARRTDKLRISFSIVDNPLAEEGELPIYMRVIDPTGNLSTAQSQVFHLEDNPMQYTAKTSINFTNRGESYNIDWIDPDQFKKGIYTILLYTDQSTMGRASIILD